MTEQEAKALAAELEYNKTWRVTAVYKFSMFHWAIDICRRDHSHHGTIYGRVPVDMLRELLNADNPGDLPWMYYNHRSPLDNDA